MKRAILLAGALAGLTSQAFADEHAIQEEARAKNGAEAAAAAEISASVRALMRPRHRQKILGSRIEAEEVAKASCLPLIAERQDASFYGFWARPSREQRKIFPDQIGSFSARHADNTINCARVSLEGGYLATDRERLSMLETNPGSALLLSMIALPVAIGAAASEDLRLADGEWAAISQVRMTCEPRPAADRLVLARARECGEIRREMDRTNDAARRRMLEASLPTYCDGIMNAARLLRATEFARVGDEACVME